MVRSSKLFKICLPLKYFIHPDSIDYLNNYQFWFYILLHKSIVGLKYHKAVEVISTNKLKVGSFVYYVINKSTWWRDALGFLLRGW